MTAIVLTVIGYVLGIPLALFLYKITENEYLFVGSFRQIGPVLTIVACLIYRLITKSSGHVLFWTLIFLCAYSGIMIAGGLLFLGWMNIFLFGSALVVSYFLLFHLPVFMRIGIAGIFICVVGMGALEIEREFPQKRCDEQTAKRDGVFHLFDDMMHAYDFTILTDPPQLVATFGLKKQLRTYDLETLNLLTRPRVQWRGIQRLTPHPDGKNLLTAAWGNWGEDNVVAVVDPQTGKPIRFFNSVDCRNAFEILYSEKQKSLYLLCEASHNLHLYNFDSPLPQKTLTFDGYDSYDVILNHDQTRLYVTDWLSPYLFVVDAENLELQSKVRIGWTAFGVVESPDSKMIYVARPLASQVVAVTAATGHIPFRIKVGYGPRDLAVDPKRNLLFVGNYFDGTLDIIDLKTHKRISRKYAGRLLRGLLVDTASDRIFLATGCGLLWANINDLL